QLLLAQTLKSLRILSLAKLVISFYISSATEVQHRHPSIPPKCIHPHHGTSSDNEDTRPHPHQSNHTTPHPPHHPHTPPTCPQIYCASRVPARTPIHTSTVRRIRWILDEHIGAKQVGLGYGAELGSHVAAALLLVDPLFLSVALGGEFALVARPGYHFHCRRG
ncbi:hypothetical protein CC80DRAFT_23598, partial [Byssothecium circinans]